MAFNSGNDKQGQTSPNYNYFGCPSLLGNGSSGRNKSPHFTFLVAAVFTGIFSITESSLADKSAVPCQASFHVYAGLHCANITFTLSFTSGMVAPLWQHHEAMICVFKIDRMHHFSTIRYQHCAHGHMSMLLSFPRSLTGLLLTSAGHGSLEATCHEIN